MARSDDGLDEFERPEDIEGVVVSLSLALRAWGALRNELPLHEVAAGRKPSGFSVPDGSRRSAKSVVYS